MSNGYQKFVVGSLVMSLTYGVTAEKVYAGLEAPEEAPHLTAGTTSAQSVWPDSPLEGYYAEAPVLYNEHVIAPAGGVQIFPKHWIKR